MYWGSDRWKSIGVGEENWLKKIYCKLEEKAQVMLSSSCKMVGLFNKSNV